MSKRSESKHIEYFDFLRVISMIGVIFMHLSSAYLTDPANTAWTLLVIPTSFFFTAVPLFFMISGALVLSSPSTIDPGALKRRMPKLIFPLFFWSAGVLILRYVSAFIHTGQFDILPYLADLLSIFLHESAIPYWFMYYLIPLYLISPFLKAAADNMTEKGWRYIEVLILAVVFYETIMSVFPQIKSYNVAVLDRLFVMSGNLAYFFLGFRLHSLKIHINNKILAAIIIADTAFISAATAFASKTVFVQTYQSYNLLFTFILSVSVFLYVKQNAHKFSSRIKKVNKYLARLSFGVYLAHVPIILLLPSIGIDISCAQGMLISFLLVPILCISITAVLSYTPLSFILVGIRDSGKAQKPKSF